jgi:hypothetical protein
MEEEENIPIYKQLPPIDERGKPKLKFDVKMRALGSDPKDGIEKAVFIDDQILDFKIDVFRFLEAKFKGMNYVIEEQKKIEREFVKSVSNFLGRKVSIQEIKKAIIEGWI